MHKYDLCAMPEDQAKEKQHNRYKVSESRVKETISVRDCVKQKENEV